MKNILHAGVRMSNNLTVDLVRGEQPSSIFSERGLGRRTRRGGVFTWVGGVLPVTLGTSE